MSSQYFPSRFDEPATRRVSIPVMVHASAARRWTAAVLDLLVVLAPLAWGISSLRGDSSLGWVGVGLGAVLLVLQVVLPLLTARSLFMTAFGLRMLDLDTGEPVGGGSTLLRHVWPPARGEVCDVRPHVMAAEGERPSETIVPPVGPKSISVEQVSGALISDVPGATSLLPPARSAPASAPISASPAPHEVVLPPTLVEPRVELPPAPSPVEEGTIARPIRPPEPAAPPGPTGPWQLAFDTGELVEVTGRLLVGRDPADGQGTAALLAIDDPERSLSKTHASIRAAGEALVLEDLDSTNGVTVVRSERDLAVPPRAPFQLEQDDQVFFGQVRAVVSVRDGAG